MTSSYSTTTKKRKFCCYGQCLTNNLDIQLNEKNGVTLFAFPTPCQKYVRSLSRPAWQNDIVDPHIIDQCSRCKKSQRWANLCQRDSPQFKNLVDATEDTYICTKHFFNPAGPTLEHPDPRQAPKLNIGIAKRETPTRQAQILEELLSKRTNKDQDITKPIDLGKCLLVEDDVSYTPTTTDRQNDTSISDLVAQLTGTDELDETLTENDLTKIIVQLDDAGLVMDAQQDVLDCETGTYEMFDENSIEYLIDDEELLNQLKKQNPVLLDNANLLKTVPVAKMSTFEVVEPLPAVKHQSSEKSMMFVVDDEVKVVETTYVVPTDIGKSFVPEVAKKPLVSNIENQSPKVLQRTSSAGASLKQIVIGKHMFKGVEVDKQYVGNLATKSVNTQKQTVEKLSPKSVEIQKQFVGKLTPKSVEIQKQFVGKLTPKSVETQKQFVGKLTPKSVGTQKQFAGKLTPKSVETQKHTLVLQTPKSVEIKKQTAGTLTPLEIQKQYAGKPTPRRAEQKLILRKPKPRFVERQRQFVATPTSKFSGKLTPTSVGLQKELVKKQSPKTPENWTLNAANYKKQILGNRWNRPVGKPLQQAVGVQPKLIKNKITIIPPPPVTPAPLIEEEDPLSLEFESVIFSCDDEDEPSGIANADPIPISTTPPLPPPVRSVKPVCPDNNLTEVIDISNDENVNTTTFITKKSTAVVVPMPFQSSAKKTSSKLPTSFPDKAGGPPGKTCFTVNPNTTTPALHSIVSPPVDANGMPVAIYDPDRKLFFIPKAFLQENSTGTPALSMLDNIVTTKVVSTPVASGQSPSKQYASKQANETIMKQADQIKSPALAVGLKNNIIDTIDLSYSDDLPDISKLNQNSTDRCRKQTFPEHLDDNFNIEITNVVSIPQGTVKVAEKTDVTNTNEDKTKIGVSPKRVLFKVPTKYNAKLNLFKMCRICMRNRKKHYEMKDKLHSSGETFYEIYLKCVNTPLSNEDKKPTTICQYCYQLLDMFYSFQLECRRSENALDEGIKLLQNNTVKEKGKVTHDHGYSTTSGEDGMWNVLQTRKRQINVHRLNRMYDHVQEIKINMCETEEEVNDSTKKQKSDVEASKYDVSIVGTGPRLQDNQIRTRSKRKRNGEDINERIKRTLTSFKNTDSKQQQTKMAHDIDAKETRQDVNVTRTQDINSKQNKQGTVKRGRKRLDISPNSLNGPTTGKRPRHRKILRVSPTMSKEEEHLHSVESLHRQQVVNPSTEKSNSADNDGMVEKDIMPDFEQDLRLRNNLHLSHSNIRFGKVSVDMGKDEPIQAKNISSSRKEPYGCTMTHTDLFKHEQIEIEEFITSDVLPKKQIEFIDVDVKEEILIEDDDGSV